MARPDITMSPAELQTFLQEQKTATLASVGQSGFPHLVAMWYIPEDAALVMWTFAKSQKARNLERDPRVGVLIEAGERYEELRGVQIRGRAELVRDYDTVFKIGVALHERYTGAQTGTPLAQVEAGLRAQAAKRVVVRVPFTRVASWDHRKLGGRY